MFFPSSKSQGQIDLEWQNVEPAEASYSEVIAESFGAGREQTLSGAVFDYADIKSKTSDDSAIIPKDEANLKMKDYGITFSEDISSSALNWHIERQENKLRREKVLGSVKDNFFKRATGFVTELGTAAIDPAEIALGGLIGTGVRLAKAGKSLATASKSMTTAALAKRGGFAATFAEALAGNVASETIIASTSNAKKEEYAISDAILNATIGTALLTGVLHGANTGIAKLLKMGDSGLDNIQNTAQKMAEIGKSPSVILEATEQAITKAEVIDDALSQMFTKHLPDEAESLSKMSAEEAVRIARKNPNFANELAQSDLRQKAWLKDDPQPTDFMTRTEMDDLTKKLDSEESDLGYDAEEIKFKNNIPEELDEVYNVDKFNQSKMTFSEQYKDQPDMLKEIDTLDNELKMELEEVTATKQYNECLQGLING